MKSINRKFEIGDLVIVDNLNNGPDNEFVRKFIGKVATITNTSEFYGGEEYSIDICPAIIFWPEELKPFVLSNNKEEIIPILEI